MIKEIYIRTPDDPNYLSGIIDFKSETEYLLNEIKVILGTSKGDVLEETNFGVNLEDLVFNTVKNSMQIEQMITQQIQVYAYIPDGMSISTRVNFGDSGLGYDYAIVDIIINGQKCMGFLIDKNTTYEIAKPASNPQERTYSDIQISLTYDVIPASGGSVFPHLSYSQTYGYNGSTTGGGTITTGASIRYSGQGVSTSNGEVSALSKQNNISDITTVTASTVVVTLNGKTASMSFVVKQEANSIVSSIWNIPLLEVFPDSFEFEYNADSSIFAITTSQSGTNTYSSGFVETITYNPEITYQTSDWITIDEDAYIISVTENTSSDDRTEEITIVAIGNGQTSNSQITVVQHPAYDLSVEPQVLNFDKLGTSQELTITTNGNWIIR